MIFNIENVDRNRIAAIEEGKTSITYGELSNFSIKIAEVLKERRVLIFHLTTNTIGSFAGYVALLSNYVVPALIDSKLDLNLLHELIKKYKPQYIWAPQMSDAVRGLDCVFEAYKYGLYQTGYNRGYNIHEDLALMLTTSGSTGSPKFVRQSYQNILSNTKSIVQYLKIREDDRAITTLPMHYTYGLSIIQTHLSVGARTIFTERSLVDKEFWNLLRNEEATTFGGVPYTYEILKKLKFSRMDLPSIRYITQAGGKLGTELHYEFASWCEQKEINFIVMYGQAEATARMSYVPSEMAIKKSGSIGIAIPGGTFKLIDSDGKEITSNEVIGEMVYTGQNVTLGYAESGEDLEKGDERKGILFTGDIGKFDEDGYYYIVGRKKRFLKIFGSRVNLEEVEILLKNAGMESVCVGEDDHMKIFTLHEDIVMVRSTLSKLTGIHPNALTVSHIKAIPRNEAGKILYAALER